MSSRSGEYGGGGGGAGDYYSSRKSRSRSRERDYNNKREKGDVEDWNKTTQAFLTNIGTSSNQVAYPGGYPHQAPGFGAVHYPYMNQPMAAYPAMNVGGQVYQGRHNVVPIQPVQRVQEDRGRSRERSTKRIDKGSASGSSDEEDGAKSYSNSASKKQGITLQQKQKFNEQHIQYKEAKLKLDTQLLKLKEQREILKEGGAKHEDSIMKENARLQKEVKGRILQMNEVITKIEIALSQPVRSKSPSPSAPKRKRVETNEKEKSRSRSPSKEFVTSSEKKKKSKRDHSSGGEEAEEVRDEKDKKKKKKKKNKTRSSSEEESDREKSSKKQRKKRKKEKKAKKSSSSASSSDSEGESKSNKKKESKSVIQMDESMFRMLADAKSGKSKKSDETLMDLLAKMSDAYVKTKHELTEMSKKMKEVEAENAALKKLIIEAQKKQEVKEVKAKNEEPREADKSDILQKAQMLLSQSEDLIEKKKSSKKSKKSTEREEYHKPTSSELTEVKKTRDRSISPPLSAAVTEERRDVKRLDTPEERDRRSASRDSAEVGERYDRGKNEDRYRGGRYRSPDRYDNRNRFGNNRYHRGGFGGGGRYDRYDRRDFRDDDRRDYRDRDDDRGHSRDYKESRDRERSKDRVEYRSKESPDSYRKKREPSPEKKDSMDPQKKDKNDRINLEDWVQRPSRTETVDSTLASSLKQKMRDRDDKERQKEEYRKRWSSKPKEDEEDDEYGSVERKEKIPEQPKGPQLAPLPTGPRSQVNIQWGTGQKKAADPNAPVTKKSAPVIGKMPGLGRSKKTPDPERGNSESRESSAPLSSSRFGASLGAMVPPPTVVAPTAIYGGLNSEMYLQAITATMPTEPPIEIPHIPARPPPKNPTPSNMDISSILAAAKAHIKQKKDEWVSTTGEVARPRGTAEEREDEGNGDIPLPPLPAAQDKDPEALRDTRVAKAATPPPPKEKSEMELMIEKHEEKPSSGFDSKDDAMDPSELEMLGIDPNDFAGFGN